MADSCPECGKTLSTKIKKCTCGWSANENSPTISDYRCQYYLAGRQCPLLGTVNPSPYGHLWYCIDHWRYLSDPVMSESILLEAEKNQKN
jgi:hypothetical protein